MIWFLKFLIFSEKAWIVYHPWLIQYTSFSVYFTSVYLGYRCKPHFSTIFCRYLVFGYRLPNANTSNFLCLTDYSHFQHRLVLWPPRMVHRDNMPILRLSCQTYQCDASKAPTPTTFWQDQESHVLQHGVVMLCHIWTADAIMHLSWVWYVKLLLVKYLL